MCDYSTVFFWYPVSHFLSRSLSLPACDLSIIYHECVLPPDRICGILSSFTFFPLFSVSSFSPSRPFIQITTVFFFFFFFFGLSQLIMCDHPTIKAAAKELPWQHPVHAVTATAERTGRQRREHTYRHTLTHTHTQTVTLLTTRAALAHLL